MRRFTKDDIVYQIFSLEFISVLPKNIDVRQWEVWELRLKFMKNVELSTKNRDVVQGKNKRIYEKEFFSTIGNS